MLRFSLLEIKPSYLYIRWSLAHKFVSEQRALRSEKVRTMILVEGDRFYDDPLQPPGRPFTPTHNPSAIMATKTASSADSFGDEAQMVHPGTSSTPPAPPPNKRPNAVAFRRRHA